MAKTGQAVTIAATLVLLGCGWRTKADVHRDVAARMSPELPEQVSSPAFAPP